MTENYHRLKPKDMKLEIKKNANGNLDLIIGMYEKSGCIQHIKMELIDFPEHCSTLENFKDFILKVSHSSHSY